MSLTMKALDQCVPEQSVAFVSPDIFSEFEKLVRSYVTRRAFTLYEEAGRPKGSNWRHWLQAESEYLFARPKVLESRDRISLFAIVPEKPLRNIEICMAPLGVIIKTNSTASMRRVAFQLKAASIRNNSCSHAGNEKLTRAAQMQL